MVDPFVPGLIKAKFGECGRPGDELGDYIWRFVGYAEFKACEWGRSLLDDIDIESASPTEGKLPSERIE
jgi:hypothetical protein